MNKPPLCYVCRTATIRFQYEDQGSFCYRGPHVFGLRGKRAIRVHICSKCGHRYVLPNEWRQLARVIPLAVLRLPYTLVVRELRFVRRRLGLTQRTVADMLGLRRRQTIGEWESDRRAPLPPEKDVLYRLALLEQLQRRRDRDGWFTPSQRQALDATTERFVSEMGRRMRGEGFPVLRAFELSLLWDDAERSWAVDFEVQLIPQDDYS